MRRIGAIRPRRRWLAGRPPSPACGPVLTPPEFPLAPPPGTAGEFTEPLEGELARFFGYSNELLAILDERGRALVLSPSVGRILGYAMNEVIGRRVLSLVHPADVARVRTQVRELDVERPVTSLDARIVRGDGSSVPMRWSLSLGPHRRVYAVGRDRTGEARRADAVLASEMMELRLRTAMELHDGILQTLTGASLQIAVARRLVRLDPERAESVLATLAETMAAEQQEMRLYVDEVKGQLPAGSGAPDLGQRIAAMLDRVQAIWGMGAVLEMELDGVLPPEMDRRILRIIQEATVNAARHGSAKAATIRVTLDGPDVAIHLTDDGHGFPFLGDYDTEALREKRLGPVVLKRRVDEAAGRIRLRSTRQGSAVSIWLPLGSGQES